MARVRFFLSPISVAACALLAACSFQSFDYLKGEYKSPTGGAGGSFAQGGRAEPGGGGSSVSGGSTTGGASGDTGGSVSAGGTTAIAGTTSTSTIGGADEGGAGGEGGAPPVPWGVLLNPGFELGSGTDVTDWVNSGTTGAATIEHINDAYDGSGRLGHWLATGAYQVSTYQTVSPIPNGNYTFSIWVRHSTQLNSEYLFARGYKKGELAAQMTQDTSAAVDTVKMYTQIILQHVPVTSGQITVGVYTDGPNDMSINWSSFDDAELTLEQP